MRDGKPVESKRVMRVIPERAARMAGHAVATPMPTGETIPSPVTTTRRRDMRRAVLGGAANGRAETRGDRFGRGRALLQAGRCGRVRGRRPGYFLTWALMKSI